VAVYTKSPPTSALHSMHNQVPGSAFTRSGGITASHISQVRVSSSPYRGYAAILRG